jgi:hypothetical protein
VKVLVGHSRKRSLTFGLYSKSPPMEKLAEAVEQISAQVDAWLAEAT